jgi:PAS domain S-box-containing protein
LSAQKQVETELRTSQAQLANQLAELAALYDSAPIGLGFFDREYRYLRINDELAAINGVPAVEHLGRSIREVLPHNAPHVEPIIDQVFATGTAVRDLEVSGETPQQPGVNRHWLTGFYPVKNSAGEVEAVGAWVVEISERKAAEQREVLLAREVDHRAKNLLAVVQAVVQLTRADSTEELKEAVLGRIQALARAHSLLANARWDGAQIGDLIREELAPYLGTPSERVRVDGPVMLLRPAAAQSLGMVIHELATNAAKYGALSVASGRLEVGWRMAGDMVELSWFETGGPPTAPPTNAGFGSQIIKVTIGRQLHGQLEQEWLPDGLKCTMRVSAKEALSDVASDPRPPPSGTGQGG